MSKMLYTTVYPNAHSLDGVVGVPTTANISWQQPNMSPGMCHLESRELIGYFGLLLVVWGDTLAVSAILFIDR